MLEKKGLLHKPLLHCFGSKSQVAGGGANYKKKNHLCKCHRVILPWSFARCFTNQSAAVWRKELLFFNVEMKGHFHSQKKHNVVSLQKPTALPAKQLQSKTGSHSEGAAAQPEVQCVSVTTLSPPSLLGLAALLGRGRGERQGRRPPRKSTPAVQSRTDCLGECH